MRRSQCHFHSQACLGPASRPSFMLRAGFLTCNRLLQGKASNIGRLDLDLSAHGTLTEALPGYKHTSQL